MNVTINRFNYANSSTKLLVDYEFHNKTSPKLIFVESENNLSKFIVGKYIIRSDLFIVDNDHPTGFDLDFSNLPVPTVPPTTIDMVGNISIALIPVYVLGYAILESIGVFCIQSYFHEKVF